MADRTASRYTERPQPVFILGMMMRSGTNFLNALVCHHPDCANGGVIWEDFLLQHSDLLTEYAKHTYQEWNPDWNAEQALGPPERLCQSLGDGLIGFLSLQRSSAPRLVTKTPSVKNVESFFSLFPRAPLLILVRDGRSVVESGIQSFDWNPEEAMHQWAEAARTVLRLNERRRHADLPYMIVRYEGLHLNTAGWMRRVLVFLGLATSAYDFEAAKAMPVLGSCERRRKNKGKVDWRSVEKGTDFEPTRRWRHWNRRMHERFNWVAGYEQVALGYDIEQAEDNRLFWFIWNILMDVGWQARCVLAKVWRTLRCFFRQWGP